MMVCILAALMFLFLSMMRQLAVQQLLHCLMFYFIGYCCRTTAIARAGGGWCVRLIG